jgi:hypothetical protein
LSYQEIIMGLHEYIIKKSKEGIFDKHPAARTVYEFYCHRMMTWDDDLAGIEKWFVFPRSTHPVHVARCTGLTDVSVKRANRWLGDQGLIEVRVVNGPGYGKNVSIRILPQEDW